MDLELRVDESGYLDLEYRGLRLVSGDFAFVGTGRESIDMHHGNFDIRDYVEERIALRAEARGSLGAQAGDEIRLSLSRAETRLELRLREAEGGLEISFPGGCPERNRFWFRFHAADDEHVYGCGEQFSHFDLRGRRFPLWTSEQGVGRNKSSMITFQADLADRAGGDYWWTFYPEPSFVSSRRYLLHADTTAYAAFDFRSRGFHELEFWSLPERILILPGSTMRDVICSASALLGRQPEPPEWVHDGVILGIQGGTAVCEEKLARAQEAGVKVTGIWAQDWEGRRITSFGKRLMWNWVWDREAYPGLDRAIAAWRERGIRFLGYMNPYVAEGKSLYAEARSSGFLALNAQGEPYLVDFGEFEAGIVDFTNPEAAAWYKSVIRKNLIELGLAGWMSDFGEYLPTDLRLHDGTPAMLAHNAWPALWARVAREALEEAGVLGEVTFFMRAGYTGSQRYSPMMWAGDQNVDWSEDDGLPSVIPAALSLAVLGHGVHHSDIGGYTTLFGLKRDRELFMRWAELAVFSSMMRTHEGNRPEENWQFDSDEATLRHLAAMSGLFVRLKPYRMEALRRNSAEGIPLMRPLFMDFEEDGPGWTTKDEFLYGEDMLVAPVIKPGADRRALHLPAGVDWVHAWSGRRFGAGEVEVEAPLGRPPVFIRGDSKRLDELLEVFHGWPLAAPLTPTPLRRG